ncbi:MAG: UDP-N-acetylmuramoyl-L-alanyl-D-glutamate-2,6-diaminopimelate ligase [Actinomycetota bacterium]
MMKLNPQSISVNLDDVVASLNIQEPATHLMVTGITHDNREVEPGFVFAALPGFNRHGAEFASTAVEQGAVAILTDSHGAQALNNLDVPLIVSANPRIDMAHAAQMIYGDAQTRLLSVGVTGTNGKTTTAHMVEALFDANDLKPIMIGTVGVRFNNETFPSSRTTPEATDLHRMLFAVEQRGSRSLVMEVSSHALSLGRVDGIAFDVAVFTGLSQDHLDFHHSMDEYFLAKAELFTSTRARHAVICVDDDWGKKLVSISQVPTLTYSVNGPADWMATDIQVDEAGLTTFTAQGPVAKHHIKLGLPGSFNIANALAAVAVSDALNLVDSKIQSALENVRVAGRLERVDCGQNFVCLVDYAHTPDAVERVVEVARSHSRGRVITVLGCGGDRDAAKRPLMGAAAAPSDLIIITDDNPRSEDPIHIRAAIRSGISENNEVVEIGDRREAIRYAVLHAQPGDWILVLGKGHETGQDLAGVVTPFDDRVVLAEILGELK